LSNTLNTSNETLNNVAIWLLLFFGLIYLSFLFLKTLFNKTYPGLITEELKSERELGELKKRFERQQTIDSFLIMTLERLNTQTCAINDRDDTHLCDKGIQEGVYHLIEPIIDNINFILDTINTKFTIGIFLKSYRSLTKDELESGILTLDDKLSQNEFVVKDLLELSNAKDEQFHIQTALRNSFNNYEFVKHEYIIKNLQLLVLRCHLFAMRTI